jgi:hypothetical protein
MGDEQTLSHVPDREEEKVKEWCSLAENLLGEDGSERVCVSPSWGSD